MIIGTTNCREPWFGGPLSSPCAFLYTKVVHVCTWRQFVSGLLPLWLWLHEEQQALCNFFAHNRTSD